MHENGSRKTHTETVRLVLLCCFVCYTLGLKLKEEAGWLCIGTLCRIVGTERVFVGRSSIRCSSRFWLVNTIPGISSWICECLTFIFTWNTNFESAYFLSLARSGDRRVIEPVHEYERFQLSLEAAKFGFSRLTLRNLMTSYFLTLLKFPGMGKTNNQCIVVINQKYDLALKIRHCYTSYLSNYIRLTNPIFLRFYLNF